MNTFSGFESEKASSASKCIQNNEGNQDAPKDLDWSYAVNADPLRDRSLWRDAVRRFSKNKAACVSCVLFSVVLAYVLLAPTLLPLISARYREDYADGNLQGVSEAATWLHPLGRNFVGRDHFVHMARAGQTTLFVGFAGAALALALGIAWGLCAGYFGGLLDIVLMRVADIVDCVPAIFLVLNFVMFFGNQSLLLFIPLSIFNWMDVARVVRGQTIDLKEKEFIEAARVGGVPRRRIIIQHILPNLAGIVVVYGAFFIRDIILTETFLSYLGLGVSDPHTSWGRFLIDHFKNGLVTREFWMPAFCYLVTLWTLNFIGDGARDALDPKDR